MSPARDQKSRFLGRRLQIPWSCCWFKWQLTFVFHVDSHTWKVTKAISTSVRHKRSVDICLSTCEINLHDHWIESSSLVLLLNGGRLWNIYIYIYRVYAPWKPEPAERGQCEKHCSILYAWRRNNKQIWIKTKGWIWGWLSLNLKHFDIISRNLWKEANEI